MAEPAISIHDIHKEFLLPQHKLTSFKQVFVNFGRHNIKKKQKVLDGINLTIQKGEFFGIIGRNGNGKSTLLKLLAGVYAPTTGSITVHGTLTPFIELGVGFNPELSGRDNVYLNGALLGFSHKEMDGMYNDIVAFAELGEFMDQKLKNYSSGMQVRLAFSIAIRAKSDILLIDEVLAVGDANFQKKCVEVFEDLKREGRTIIFITHSMEYVRRFCDRVAVLDHGKIQYMGEPERAIDLYNKLNFELDQDRIARENEQNKEVAEHLGNGKAVVESYTIYDAKGKPTNKLMTGKQFSIELTILYKDAVENPDVGVLFRKNPLENLYGINSLYEHKLFGRQKAGNRHTLRFTDTMPLHGGDYYFTITVSDARSPVDYEELDLLNNVQRVSVVQKEQGWAIVQNHATIEERKHR